jgi:protein-disulfide isomerase
MKRTRRSRPRFGWPDPYFAIGLFIPLGVGILLVSPWSEPPPDPDVTAVARSLDTLGISHRRGEGPVIVVEFADFACDGCAAAHELTEPLLASHVQRGDVTHVVYDLPLTGNPAGMVAARVGHCVGADPAANRWRFRDQVYRYRDEWKHASDPLPPLVDLATAAGADPTRLSLCLDVEAERQVHRLEAGVQTAIQAGVSSVPLWTVDGRRVGARTFARALAEAAAGNSGVGVPPAHTSK